MKKIIWVFAAVIMSAVFAGTFFKSAGVAVAQTDTLRIYNWEEYIAEDAEESERGKDLIDDFKDWYKAQYGRDINVVYSTFGTNEIMYNELKINPGSYDLVCPSDYMIDKLIKEDMLEKMDPIDSYEQYASGYIKELFSEHGWDEYAVGYMWGTMGFIYNPAQINPADAQTWAAVWNIAYNKKTTLKDSIRDTYFLGVSYVYRDELNKLADELKRDKIALEIEHGEGTEDFWDAYNLKAKEYNDAVTEIINRTDAETVKKVEAALLAAKQNIFSFEVDDGKKDMVTGKINLNFCWSGDAIYVMDLADEDGVELYYSIPKESGNIWFDGWVMPKGANKQAAQAFLEYISQPAQAMRNMDFIGYTSVIAGQEVFDRAVELYDEGDGEYQLDLSYFFDNLDEGEDAIINTNSLNRQLFTSYPDYDTIIRCAIMSHFEDEELERVNSMWERVRGATLPVWVIVLIVIGLVMVVGGAVVFVILSRKTSFKRKNWTVIKKD